MSNFILKLLICSCIFVTGCSNQDDLLGEIHKIKSPKKGAVIYYVNEDFCQTCLNNENIEAWNKLRVRYDEFEFYFIFSSQNFEFIDLVLNNFETLNEKEISFFIGKVETLLSKGRYYIVMNHNGMIQGIFPEHTLFEKKELIREM